MAQDSDWITLRAVPQRDPDALAAIHAEAQSAREAIEKTIVRSANLLID
jgi:hypothetical protein